MPEQPLLFPLPAVPDNYSADRARLRHRLEVAADDWVACPPSANPNVVERLCAEAGVALPESYLALLAFSNGPEGPLRLEPGWFRIWPAEQVLELNEGYRVPDYLPGCFGFGCNGGGELLAFQVLASPPYPIMMIPFIPMDAKEAIVIAQDFEAFIGAMGKGNQ